MMRPKPLYVLIMSVMCAASLQARKFDSFEVNSAGKLTPIFVTSPANFVSQLRARLEASFEKDIFKVDAAYDNQLTFATSAFSPINSTLPLLAPTPFRLWPISGTAQGGDFTDFQQLDRAFVRVKTSSFDTTLGRQPIGLGRGMMFSAVDIFAPFTPLQIDQEWRPGVDALSLDYRMTDTVSLQAIYAAGSNWDSSAVAGRIRGYIGPVDAEVIVAKRQRDVMYAAVASTTVLDAEVHGEIALFQTPGDTGIIPKAVLGVSNNFALGQGLKVSLEYHYSGFGAKSSSQINVLLNDPAFLARLTQGATQIIGAQVLGLNASYTFSTQLSGSLTCLQSLIDVSGILAPEVTWDFAEFASLLGAAYIGFGQGLNGNVVQSQFGSVTPTFILRLRVYD